MPLVVEMPGRCPKCGGRLMKAHGQEQKTGKQYTYYCCEFGTSRDEKKCDFMTWDVPTKDGCPVCGQTMFKKAGKGFQKPFCINPRVRTSARGQARLYAQKGRRRGSGGGERGSAAPGKEVRREENDRENRREEDCREKTAASPAAKSAKAAAAKDRRQKDGKEGRELMQVSVIGAGLAGCEAAWRARGGIAVTLYEMKPAKRTPAHHSDDLPSCAARTPCAPTSWRTRWDCSRRSCAARR